MPFVYILGEVKISYIFCFIFWDLLTYYLDLFAKNKKKKICKSHFKYCIKQVVSRHNFSNSTVILSKLHWCLSSDLGAFNNYVDQILPTYPLAWTIMDILLTTYPLFTWPSMDFLLTTCLPVLVHVVIKWPLTTLQRHNKVSLSMYRSISLLTLWFDKSQLYDNIRWFIKVNGEGTILKM